MSNIYCSKKLVTVSSSTTLKPWHTIKRVNVNKDHRVLILKLTMGGCGSHSNIELKTVRWALWLYSIGLWETCFLVRVPVAGWRMAQGQEHRYNLHRCFTNPFPFARTDETSSHLSSTSHSHSMASSPDLWLVGGITVQGPIRQELPYAFHGHLHEDAARLCCQMSKRNQKIA